jgi:tryptophan-rich sensory protein
MAGSFAGGNDRIYPPAARSALSPLNVAASFHVQMTPAQQDRPGFAGGATMTTRSLEPRRAPGWLSAAASVAAALAVGALGALATASSVASWYPGLNKPAFNPPNAVFGPVWTTLYVLMALAAWRVWRSGAAAAARRRAMLLYAVQLALNLAWSVIFFGLRQPGLALAEIVLLLAAVAACTAAFWRADRIAGLMMVPYAAWTAFASVLNFEIWRLN